MLRQLLILPILGLVCFALADTPTSLTLEKQLAYEDPKALAAAAKRDGDPRRGAILFYSPKTACIKCHAVGSIGGSLGPDLTKLAKDTSDEHLVDSVLFPSKVIAKDFETVIVATTDGRSLTGLLVEDGKDQLVLRDGADPAKLITLKPGEIEARKIGKQSLMPAGLVNTLADRQEFLDLVRYLVELRDGGAGRAKELEPPASAYALQVPEYEQHIDHAGLIKDSNDVAYRRGEAIYSRLCVNCHGTHHDPGSLPTSLRFARDKFKNGSDPLSMYRTLTYGYGLMTPQPLVPMEKYDVIHFIREAYLRGPNKSQYVPVDQAYLAKLPRGNTRGPKPVTFEPWLAMDYGPSLIHTYEAGTEGKNIAQKGIAILVPLSPLGGEGSKTAGGVVGGNAWMLFEHDTLRVAAAWTGQGFIDWNGVQFNGRHAVHPRVVGDVHFALPTGPGWADPETGKFDDPRLRGRDGKPYGPLPRKWGRYLGLYHHGERVVVAYTVGDATILETFAGEAPVPLSPLGRGVRGEGPSPSTSKPLTPDPSPQGGEGGKAGTPFVFSRTLNIAKSSRDLVLRVAAEPVAVAVVGSERAKVESRDGFVQVRIPAGATPARLKVLSATPQAAGLAELAKSSPAPEDLEPLTRRGPRRWTEQLTQPVLRGREDGPFAVDVLMHPEKNPWQCQIRCTGLDFYPDGKRLALCTWDGDVWLVSGLTPPEPPLAKGGMEGGGLTWQRIASGLFQPLGLKIIDGKIHVTCRDQLVRLHDLNGDGETDFYECINSDHQVTEHFHEFAMGLQTDAEGNFYYAKSARHALPALVPHHGTLLRVSKDGARTDILASGFRAANGVCLNPDGTFFVTDQEGHWTPKNRINWVKSGGFYGNLFGYHDVTDTSDAAMEQPVCWVTNAFDRSPAELLWVTSDRWGPLKGSLLNLSYGYGQIYVVPHEVIDGKMQGGVAAFPLPRFPTGIMRGRFHPADGQLYVCGMYSWAGNQMQPGGLYRVRYTGKPAYLPLALHAKKGRIEVTFSGELDGGTPLKPDDVTVKTWSLKRTENYGSAHHDERRLVVSRASVAADGKTLLIEMPELRPTMSMEIRYTLRGKDGQVIDGVIHNTIHALVE